MDDINLTLTEDEAAELLMSMEDDGPLFQTVAMQIDLHAAEQQASADRSNPAWRLH